MSNGNHSKDPSKGQRSQGGPTRKRPVYNGSYEFTNDILEKSHKIAQSPNLRYSKPVSKEQQLREAIQKIYNMSSSEAKKYSTPMHAEISLNITNKFSNASEMLVLPEKAKVLYVDRENKKQNPLDFFEAQYGDLKRAGKIFGDDLLRLDRQLSTNMRSFCQRKNLNASDYMPPPKRAKTDMLVAVGQSDENVRMYLRAERSFVRRPKPHTPKNM